MSLKIDFKIVEIVPKKKAIRPPLDRRASIYGWQLLENKFCVTVGENTFISETEGRMMAILQGNEVIFDSSNQVKATWWPIKHTLKHHCFLMIHVLEYINT